MEVVQSKNRGREKRFAIHASCVFHQKTFQAIFTLYRLTSQIKAGKRKHPIGYPEIFCHIRFFCYFRVVRFN